MTFEALKSQFMVECQHMDHEHDLFGYVLSNALGNLEGEPPALHPAGREILEEIYREAKARRRAAPRNRAAREVALPG